MNMLCSTVNTRVARFGVNRYTARIAAPAASYSSSPSSQTPAQTLLQTRQKGLKKLWNTLSRDRYAMVDSSTMMEWLNADLMPRRTNAQEEIPTIQRLWTECPSQRSENNEIIYQHKKVFHSRYQLDRGLERETYDIDTDADGTERQEYNAHVSTSTNGVATQHYKRYYPALPATWDNDRLLGAVRRLFADVAAKPRQRELGVRAPSASVVYQFCYRTEMDRHYRDPGPEGVHVDGATLGMVLVTRRENIKPETGGTRIWSAQQATGKPTAEDLASNKLLNHWKPSKTFDALFFMDESVTHEALEGELEDPDRKGYRDMLILDVRRKDRAWAPDTSWYPDTAESEALDYADERLVA